jgi:hypothetical protein
VVVEARKYSALAIDTLVELTKDNHPGFNALQRRDGASRPRFWPPGAIPAHGARLDRVVKAEAI